MDISANKKQQRPDSERSEITNKNELESNNVPNKNKNNKKEESQKETYIAILILGVVFILGFLCGKAFGKSGGTPSESDTVSMADVTKLIADIENKHEKQLLQESDIEELKTLVQGLKFESSFKKDPAQMSHQEIMDTLSKPVYPNLARDIMLEKLYTFLIGVVAIVLCLVWVMLFPSNRR